ncbi:MAG: hypothetical protein C0503_00905 [Gemmatimonas sp.]|nr:hypothetical protein [Gemmatimonas sp.]
MRRLLPAALLLVAACAKEAPPSGDSAARDAACFGTRILSYRDLVAEVVIPSGESCGAGSFQVVFTRAADTLETLTETRNGTVGFIGTADVTGDGRGEFIIATYTDDSTRTGTLYAYSDSGDGIVRFPITDLAADQRDGYAGMDRFGFGGADQLVRAFPRGPAGDTAWFAYSHGESRWTPIERPSWVR